VTIQEFGVGSPRQRLAARAAVQPLFPDMAHPAIELPYPSWEIPLSPPF
jgi:hypothetical protein